MSRPGSRPGSRPHSGGSGLPPMSTPSSPPGFGVLQPSSPSINQFKKLPGLKPAGDNWGTDSDRPRSSVGCLMETTSSQVGRCQSRECAVECVWR